MTFPVVMYRCESWTTEKAERQRMEAFKLWCCRRLLRVWTARRRNKPILKEINPEYSLEGLMLKLKFQNFVHLIEELTHWKRPWCWERFRVGGGGGNRQWYGWMASLTQWTCILSKLQGSLAWYSPWGHKDFDTLSDWTRSSSDSGKKSDIFTSIYKVWYIYKHGKKQ